MLTPEALIDFVEELRHAGFNIGMAEYIAAQDLLLILTSRGENLNDPQRVSSLFGPLLCNSPAEQDAFPEFFRRWYDRQKSKLESRKIPREETMAETLEDTAKRGLRWEWILFVFGVIVLVSAAWLVFRNFERSELQPFALPNNLPDAMSDALPLIQLASVALGILVITYFAWWTWWRRTASQFLQKRQSQVTPDIKRISLTASDEALFPSLTFLYLARLFRQRVQVISKDLNVVATVESSVENGGWLNPVYDQLLIPPEYLVLVDRRSRFDHLAEFVDGMVERLEEHGVFITAYAFDGDPRLCFPLRGNGVPQSLNELAARYENMRLIVFTEAQGLLSPISGRLAPWTRLFNRWVHRSVLTPESPDNWGITEHELQREFTILPGTTEGLAMFMRIVQGQEEKLGEINTWVDSALPMVVQERPQRWLEKDTPSASQIDSLLDDLRLYLGEDGFTWLKACAVYPELHWQITVTLGQFLKGQNGSSLLDSKRLIDLARLPWFRYGIMPNWLRTRLVLDLETDQEEEIRTVLEALLVTAVQGHGESLDLEIAYERRDWTSRLARPLLRLLQRESASESPIQDHVFLDFMLQHLNLAVRVPEALRRQLFTNAGDQAGWKVMLRWLVANILAVSLYTLVDLYSPQEVLFASLLYAFVGLGQGFAQWIVLRRYWKINAFLWVGACGLIFSLFPFFIVDQVFSGWPDEASLFGLLYLMVLGIFQAGILARNKLPSFYWFLGCIFAGITNTVWSFLFQISSGEFTSGGVLVVHNIVSAILYSMISGWFLLNLLKPSKGSFYRFLRPIWVTAISVGLTLGIILLALVGGFDNAFNLNQTILSILTSVAWMFPFSLSQMFALRVYHKSISRSWFWLTWVFASIGIYPFIGYLLNLNSEETIVFFPMGVSLGIVVGLTQSLIWRRLGSQPFQLLIWLLSNVLGLSLAFGGLDSFSVYFPNINTNDQGILFIMLSLSLYGLITAWPLKSLLREVLSSRKAIRTTGKE